MLHIVQLHPHLAAEAMPYGLYCSVCHRNHGLDLSYGIHESRDVDHSGLLEVAQADGLQGTSRSPTFMREDYDTS